MIKCDTTIDKKAVVKIYKYYVKRHPRVTIARTILILTAIFLIFLCGGSLLLNTLFNKHWGFFGFFMLFGFLFGFLTLWYVFLGAKKISLSRLSQQFFTQQQQSVVIHYTFDQKGLRIEKADSNSFYSWSLLKTIQEQADCYIFEVNTERYNLVDKKGFKGNQHVEFQELLQKVLQPNQIKQDKSLKV